MRSLILVSLIAFFGGCTQQNIISDKTQQAMETMVVKKGDQFTIKLEANIATGYTWELKEPLNKELLSLVKKEYLEGDEEKEGAPGLDVFTILAVKEGTTVVKFWLVRPFVKNKAQDPNVKYKDYELKIE